MQCDCACIECLDDAYLYYIVLCVDVVCTTVQEVNVCVGGGEGRIWSFWNAIECSHLSIAATVCEETEQLPVCRLPLLPPTV